MTSCEVSGFFCGLFLSEMATLSINDDRGVTRQQEMKIEVEEFQTRSFANEPANHEEGDYDQQAVFCVIAENGHLSLLMTADTIPSGAVPALGLLMRT